MAVLLCSGQGAQKPHMGEDLLAVAEVAQVLECAHDVLGLDAAGLICQGSAEDINNTYNAQVLTMALSVGIGKALMARGLSVEAVIGFSLGEISGLVLSGILSLEQAFSLLNVRAHAMDEACQQRSGGMLALLGASEQQAEALCSDVLQQGVLEGVMVHAGSAGTDAEEPEVLVPANYNCPGQIVISGDVSAIERAKEFAKDRKIRATQLATAGAFHSPLMAAAAAAVKEFCQTLVFNQPTVPLICNTDAREFDVSQAPDRLARQIVSPVRFEQSVRYAIGKGSIEFVEAGFGGVLFNLMKRIDKTVQRKKVGTLEEMEGFSAS